MPRRAGDERPSRRARLGQGGANAFDRPGPGIVADRDVRGDRSGTQLAGVVEHTGAGGRLRIGKARAGVIVGYTAPAAGECP